MQKTYNFGVSLGIQIGDFFNHEGQKAIKSVFPEYSLGADLNRFCRQLGYDEIQKRIEGYYQEKNRIHVGDIVIVSDRRTGLVTKISNDRQNADIINCLFADGDTGCYPITYVKRHERSTESYDFFVDSLAQIFKAIKDAGITDFEKLRGEDVQIL